MLYLANPCSDDAVIAAMLTGLLGFIDTPRQRNPRPAGVSWAADNGCFTDRWDEDKWWRWLTVNAGDPGCLFATAPDVVADAAATLERAGPWMPRMRQLGYPVAFVAQDGLEGLRVPWDSFQVLFVGGSTMWKMGPHARALVGQAHRHGKRVHFGRVNSQRRYLYAYELGCHTADGTTLTRGSRANLPHVLSWPRAAAHPRLLEVS